MKKKKKKRRSMAPLIIIMSLILITVIGGGAFFYLNAYKLMLPGEWTREIDITDYAKEAAASYLSEAAFGDEISIEEYISDLKVTSMLQVTKEGEIVESLDRESYDQALKACQAGLEKAVSDLIERRIKESYIETDMSVDALINETFGMSLEGYLNEYGPKLIPDFEELEERYGSSAYYEASRDSIIIRNSETTDAEYNYAVSHGMLVIDYSDGAVVYYER